MSNQNIQRRFLIQYVDRPGHKGSQPREKSPVMEVAIGWKNFEKVRALVDTGSDDIFVDYRLLDRTGCPMLPKVMSVRTQHAEMKHGMYQATLVLTAEKEFRCNVEAIATNIDDGTKAYSVVLGTSFLEMGRLVVEPEGESHFTLHERYIGPLTQDNEAQ